jgi:hypothetical protein
LDLGQRVLGICEHIDEVDHLSLEDSAPDHRAALREIHMIPNETFVFWVEARECNDPVHVSLASRDVADVGIAEPYGTVDHSLEDDLEVEGRTSDRLDHVEDGGLAGHRVPQFVAEVGLAFRSRIVHLSSSTEHPASRSSRADLVATPVGQ